MIHREGWDLPECARVSGACGVKDEALGKYLGEKGFSDQEPD